MAAVRAAAAVSLLAAAGCSAGLATMQPAQTLPKGGWHAGAGVNVQIPVTRTLEVLDAAQDIDDSYVKNPDYTPTEEEQHRYQDAMLGLALSAPGATVDLMLRHGFARRFDAGVRFTTTAVHADGKYQFLGEGDGSGWDGAISLGYAHHLFDSLVFDVLEHLGIDDFAREDLQIPLIFGRRMGQWGFLWGGPKYVLTYYAVDARIANAAEVESTEGFVHYVGGFAGVALGWRWVHAIAELTVMDLIAKPTIAGREVDVGGIIVVPSLGLMARW